MNTKIISAKLLTGFSIMAISTSASFAVEIIAHRGASHDAPENTMAAFKLGYEQKADAVEIDIHLTKDGKIFTMHDYDTLRVSGVSNKIVETDFADLRKLEVGQWGQWKGKGFSERGPGIDEVLALIPDGKKMFVEIKVHPEILPELDAAFKRSGKKDKQLTIITFHYDTAEAAKKLWPKKEVYWLMGWKKDKAGNYPNIDDLIKKAKAAKLDGLNLNSGFPIDKAFAKKVHDAGLKLYTWTVDDPEVAKKEVEAGVDGITTNRPEFLRAQLKK
jgi:glycerophosphoryl diester phosphodiesterase